jgi:hypothetical protein
MIYHITYSEDLTAGTKDGKMTTTELRQVAKQTIENLPPDQLKVAAEFLRYLDQRASVEATNELLKIPGLLEDIAEAERDIAAGRTTPVEKLKRKYKKNVSRRAKR